MKIIKKRGVVMRDEYANSLMTWFIVSVLSLAACVLGGRIVGAIFFGGCFTLWLTVSVLIFMDSTDEDSWVFRFLTRYLKKKPEAINLCSVSGMLGLSIFEHAVESLLIFIMIFLGNFGAFLAAKRIVFKYRPYSGEDLDLEVKEIESLKFGKHRWVPGKFVIIALGTCVAYVIVSGLVGVISSCDFSGVFISDGAIKWYWLTASTILAGALCYYFWKLIFWNEIKNSVGEIFNSFHKSVCIIKDFRWDQEKIDGLAEDELMYILERENSLGRN
ncbi:hypothetical protein ACFL08_01670 [Patescibacteria group bacterium]